MALRKTAIAVGGVGILALAVFCLYHRSHIKSCVSGKSGFWCKKKEPEVAKHPRGFDGVYLGVQGGYVCSSGMRGYDVGGFVGWGRAVLPSDSCGIYLGIEATGLWMDIRGHKKAKIHDSFQLSFRFGMPICNRVMPYIKAGYDNARWHLKSGSKRLSGAVFGGGIEAAVTEHLRLGVEFDYSIFPKHKARDAHVDLRIAHLF